MQPLSRASIVRLETRGEMSLTAAPTAIPPISARRADSDNYGAFSGSSRTQVYNSNWNVRLRYREMRRASDIGAA